MKKSRIYLALLLTLVAFSGFAQDSYREAVKQYMAINPRFEKTKSMVKKMSQMFENNDKVDVDQLTDRYINERFEDDMVDYMYSTLKDKGLTENELIELATLFSTPQGKIYAAHEDEWITDLMAEMAMSMMESFRLSISKPEMVPVEPKADIDPDYAAKFLKVMEKSDLSEQVRQLLSQRLNRDETKHDMSNDMFIDWATKSVPYIALNSAYGKMTLEDLDFAEVLYTRDSYRKLQSLTNFNIDEYKADGNVINKYRKWMEEQGATETEDWSAIVGVLKSLINVDKVKDRLKGIFGPLGNDEMDPPVIINGD